MSKTMDDKPIYRRILLKLSGEALQGDNLSAIDLGKLDRVASEIKGVVDRGVQVGVVIGGGNLIRGTDLHNVGIDRITSDQMGMLATVINGLALRDSFNKKSMPVAIMSAIAIQGLADLYNHHMAVEALQRGQVVIFVGGTGNPLVTTDSAAALRGIEVNADIVLKATKVDGVFAADPVKNPKAVRYDTLTYDEVIEQRLAVMDLNAILLCRDNNIPLRVFNMNKSGELLKIIRGETTGTLIKGGEKS